MRSRTAKIWTSAAVAALLAAPITASANPIGDAWITTKVKIRLIREPGIAPLKVNVDTNDGFVTLQGAVSTEDGVPRARR
jgi:osmotically-inducible protein OsmY